jgi:hypothetical protein
MAGDSDSVCEPKKLALRAQFAMKIITECFKKHGAGIMPGKPVLLAWITQANNQFDAVTHGVGGLFAAFIFVV